MSEAGKTANIIKEMKIRKREILILILNQFYLKIDKKYLIWLKSFDQIIL